MADSDVDWTAYTTVLGEARVAFRAGSYGTARLKVAEAKIVLAALPASVTASPTGAALRDDLTALEQLLNKLEDDAKKGGEHARIIRTRIGR